MWVYWLIFLLPAGAALLQPTRAWALEPPAQPLRIGLLWFFVATVLAALIGFRDEVGGDWKNYLAHLYEVAGASVAEVISRAEPGYWLVAWLASGSPDGIYLANLVFGFIFSIGLAVFCRAQPRPWLALAVAVPYMVIVLAMGYSRQGVALGFAMVGLVALARRKAAWFLGWILLAALFHRSAIVMAPLAVIGAPGMKKWLVLLLLGIGGLAVYDGVIRESVETLQANYLEAEYQSQGALVRVMMNVVPALILLVARKRLISDRIERKVWSTMAWVAVGTAAWLAASPSSTAVDRFALYLIPLQIYAFSRVPDLLTRTVGERRAWIVLVLGYYAFAQFVWLNFATHAEFWLPYQFYPLTDSF